MSDISCCGTKCSSCYCYGNLCKGCNASEGHVFHVPEEEVCAIYACVINQKGYKNCGECDEVPCSIWMKTRDPKFSDKEFEENIAMRVQQLKEV